MSVGMDYCQFLLSSQKKYTQTHYADHAEQLNHDRINRYLSRAKLKPRLLWQQIKGDIMSSSHGIIQGIGVAICLYVNPETEQSRAIDFRIFDPDRDGKTTEIKHGKSRNYTEKSRIIFYMIIS